MTLFLGNNQQETRLPTASRTLPELTENRR